MQLEVQINNLGFKRTPSQMQKSIMASRHASSLGESFMILDESKSSTAPPPGSNQTSAGARRYSNDITQPSVGHSPPQKSRADVKLPVHVTSSPPNPQPELAVEPQQQQQQQLPSLNSLLQILPYIASFGMGTNGQGVPDKQQEAALANVMETIEWNEKSMFLSPQKRPWKKQESSSSTSPEANCDENASNESILRLLTTIATLRK